MKKFAFIGAGSLQFTSKTMIDILSFPAFEECEIALMDINPKNLKYMVRVCERIKAALNKPKCKVTSTLDRAEALKDADGVLCTVFNGDVDIWRYDIEIPKKYGVDINIGDTRSVSGIFRALRNIPLMLDICRDIEKYCPNAVFLNYTNPMAMLTGYMLRYTPIQTVGLCHSVQVCSETLLKEVGMEDKLEGRKELIAGINHMGWLLELKDKNGVDLYPEIKSRIGAKMEDPEFMDKVRFDYIRNFGY